MHLQRVPAPSSTYESQAARWKQGFQPTAQGHRQTDLEGALISELCSSIGSSSFPPRDVLQKLLRYLHTLDHEYICELLNGKFQNTLWQVQGKALSVLDALLKSNESEFYKCYYSERQYILQELCQSRKEMLRARAEKVYNVIKAYVPPPSSLHASESSLVQSSPIDASMVQQDLMPSFHSPVSSASSQASYSIPMGENVSAFGFLTQSPDEHTSISNLSAVASEPPPSEKSAFSFLSNAPPSPPLASSAPPASTEVSGFSFLSSATPIAAPSAIVDAEHKNPIAPASNVSGFSYLSEGVSTPVIAGPPTRGYAHSEPARSSQPVEAPPVSAFSFLSSVPTPSPPQPHVFDALLAPTSKPEGVPLVPPTQSVVSDPIHDAFEGLSMDDTDESHPLDAVGQSQIMQPASQALEPVPCTESLREVILEIELPPGPMGVMLDRTITDMAVIERFIPLPSGGKGYLELHPAICPGCALVSINSINLENKSLDEVGGILASFASSHKVLRFKKLMNNGRTANPSTLMMPYIPPPMEDEENDVEKEGEDFMVKLNGYNDQLVAIEQQLEDLIRREQQSTGPITGMNDQLAQLHGTVEKIQTQGIDSVIIGASRPSNYDDIKKLRSGLVRKADALAKRIQRAAQGDSVPLSLPPPVVKQPSTALVGSDGTPLVSAFGFVNSESSTVAGAENPLIPLSESTASTSRFPFLASTTSEATAADSSAFSFLQSTQPVDSDLAASSSSSAFRFLQSSTVSSLGESPKFECPTTNEPVVSTSVFSGLSVRDDSLSSSSHGRPMGLSDLSQSTSSFSSSVPTDPAPIAAVSMSSTTSYSAFGFLSTPAAPSEPEISSPTSFSFLRGNLSTSTASSSSSTIPGPINLSTAPIAQPDQQSTAAPSSAFSFISS